MRSRGSLRMSPQCVPAAHVLVVHERGLVPARAGDRDRDGRCVGGRDAAPPGQRGHARDDLRHRRRHEAARVGARGHGRAVRCRSSRWSHARTDRPARPPSRRSRTFFGSPPCTSRTRRSPRLRAVHAEVSIYGWLDSWCLGWARFDWEGGPVWGWDGVVSGERSVLRIVPEHQAAVVLMTNGSTGRAMYRSLFAELMESLFGISVPPLRLDASPGAAGDLSRFAGVYAWPDRRVEVTAAGSGLLIKERGRRNGGAPARRADLPRRRRGSGQPHGDVRRVRRGRPAAGALRHAVGTSPPRRVSVGDAPPPSCHVAHARRPADGGQVGMMWARTPGRADPVATSCSSSRESCCSRRSWPGQYSWCVRTTTRSGRWPARRHRHHRRDESRTTLVVDRLTRDSAGRADRADRATGAAGATTRTAPFACSSATTAATPPPRRPLPRPARWPGHRRPAPCRPRAPRGTPSRRPVNRSGRG